MGAAAKQVRVAVMSDLHLESDRSLRARCRSCGGTLVAARQGRPGYCPCRESMLDLGSHGLVRGAGMFDPLPRRSEQWPGEVRSMGADIAVLAGDIHRGAEAVRWAAEAFPWLPVAIVPGNHEMYGGDIPEVLAAMRAAASGTPNVRVLSRGLATYRVRGARVRVLGATLWTDYALLAAAGISQADSMAAAARRMNDHKAVRLRGKPFRPEDALRLHRLDRDWLARTLAKPFEGVTIVATHHAPVPLAITPEWRDSNDVAAYASDLSALFWRHAPDLVVWGHTHAAVDEGRSGTRLVSHPRGYAWEGRDDWTPKLVEVPAR